MFARRGTKVKDGTASAWWISVGVALLVGAFAVAYLFKPVTGPARNFNLIPNAVAGAYLVRLGGCVTCHTDHQSNGEMLAGGAAIKTQFGTFYPPNITPDKRTGIGTWSLARFSDALSNGHGAQGNLYPVFPYDNLTLMSDQDIVDLYAGVMATPPIEHKTHDQEAIFPLNIRPLISVWKNLFFSPHRFQNDNARSVGWNRGAYLANGPGHCVACHSPRNALGAIEDGHEFTGNPIGGPGGKAPPITETSLLGDGYSVQTLIDTLKTGITPSAGKVGGPMGEVIRDESSHWTDDDLSAISAYLLGRK